MFLFLSKSAFLYPKNSMPVYYFTELFEKEFHYKFGFHTRTSALFRLFSDFQICLALAIGRKLANFKSIHLGHERHVLALELKCHANKFTVSTTTKNDSTIKISIYSSILRVPFRCAICISLWNIIFARIWCLISRLLLLLW